MGNTGDAAAPEARDSAAFVAAMRRLKERSGLTYRQLEDRAAERGGVLPRSTLADVLRQDTLPRAEIVSALLLACGEEAHTDAWLEIRERIAAGGAVSGPAPTDGPEPGTTGTETVGSGDGRADRPGASDAPRWPRSPLGSRGRSLTTVLSLAALVAGAYFAVAELSGRGPGAGDGRLAESAADASREGSEESGGAASETTAKKSPAQGTYRIRSVASSLCLSERDGEGSGNVYQSGCEGAVPVYALEKAESGAYRIRSLHPTFGKGCLGVDEGSTHPGARMVDDYCGHRGVAERFRLQPTAEPARGYRLKPLHADTCVTVPGGSAKEGTSVLQLPCDSGLEGQIFRFDPVPAPRGIPTPKG
ncbi:RICIN domain-containing protein [Streptomyces daliensis]